MYGSDTTVRETQECLIAVHCRLYMNRNCFGRVLSSYHPWQCPTVQAMMMPKHQLLVETQRFRKVLYMFKAAASSCQDLRPETPIRPFEATSWTSCSWRIDEFPTRSPMAGPRVPSTSLVIARASERGDQRDSGHRFREVSQAQRQERLRLIPAGGRSSAQNSHRALIRAPHNCNSRRLLCERPADGPKAATCGSGNVRFVPTSPKGK